MEPPLQTATAATGVGFLLALGLFFTSAKFRRNKDDEMRRQDKSKEQEAKASFRVRRQNLMAISGRGNKKKRQKIHKGKHQGGRNDNISYDGNDVQLSWLGKLMYWIRQIISFALSLTSFGYIKAQHDNSNDTSKQSNSATKVQSLAQINKRSHHNEQSIEGYYNDVIVVGLDCEMVGGGRNGWKSLLARCSVVTLDGTPHDESSTKQTSSSSSSSLEDNLIVLYDKYIIPKAKITDYRTEWSGITGDTYKDPANSPIPIVSFNQCQNEISQLFSSIDGKRVVVVGHALENDFEALEIEHPQWLTRDTAFYPPYMRRVRRKMYPRKLSVLTSEKLDIEIQQKSEHEVPPPLAEEGKAIKNPSMVGHSSVEDGAAALRLYWHEYNKWERSLG